MALLANSFEGQTDGVTMTSANSANSGATFGSVTAAAFTFEDAAGTAIDGSTCILFSVATGSTALWDIDDAVASPNFSLAFYVYLTAYPSVTNAQFPVSIRSTGAALGRIEMSSTGQLRGVVNATTSAYTTTGLALNTWYRIEAQGTGWGTAATTLDVQFFVGHGTTAADSFSMSGQTSTAQVQRLRYGKIAASPAASIAGRLDAFRQNIGSSTALGPATQTLASSVNDTHTLSESALISRSAAVTDTATLVSELTSVGLSTTDTATVTEGAAGLTANITVTDSATTQELASETITDEGVDDSFLIEQPSSVAVANTAIDAQTQTDAAAITSTTPLTDSFTMSDVAEVAQVINVSDSSTLTEGATSLTVTVVGVDSAAQTESPTTITGSIVVADSQALSDVSSVLSGTAVVASDTATQTDVSQLTITTFVVANDSGTLVEGASSISAAGSLTDTATQSDVAALTTTLALSASDSATQSDASGYTATVGVAETHTQTDAAGSTIAIVGAADDLTLTESTLLNAGGLFNGTDTFTLDDVASTTSGTTAVDAATQTDSAVLAVFISVTDLQTQVEGGTQTQLTISVTDTFTQVETPPTGLLTGDAIVTTDVLTLTDLSSITRLTALAVNDTMVQSEGATLLAVDVPVEDIFILIDDTPMSDVSVLADDLFIFEDVATRDALSELEVNVDWLAINRSLTKIYIRENPVEIKLTPHLKVRTPSGGYVMDVGTQRPKQIMRVIEASGYADTGLSRVETGFQREKTYQLMAEWNAEMDVNDTFTYGGGDWTIESFMPFNGYERRAVVRRVGN